MCDTFVALGNSTADGSTLFAKNSDREANEAHQLLMIPAADHPEGTVVQCTYIHVPQVKHTNAVLLAKPFWIWGAEMGANEQGVVIGNEAVFTRVPYDKKPGLIGMDFIRLALERSQSADEALKVITSLLEIYGQGGNCGMTHPFYYHNSFLIADGKTAWVLETAGNQWAAAAVRDVRSISNALTIGAEWDLASADLVNLALDRGWCKDRTKFNFADCYSDFLYTRFSDAHRRQSHTQTFLQQHRGRITLAQVMNLLRSHGEVEPAKDWTPAKGVTGATVCMHAGFGPVRNSRTAGSMVTQWKDGLGTHWLTGTAAPCTGIFKPVWMDAGLPDLGPNPTGVFNDACLWWRHEQLHREVVRHYGVRLSIYRQERDDLETTFQTNAAALVGASSEERRAFSEACFSSADQAEQDWIEQVRAVEGEDHTGWLARKAWNGFNRAAKMYQPEY